ncbi:MAG: hypothetical protein KY462_07695 [Actinobacteria bacterium]|nr:hypothetical protein [Actinomycetota bacterium]
MADTKRPAAPVVTEGVALLATLALSLVLLTRTLRSIASTVGRITAGVRAIETQLNNAGAALHRLNGALNEAVDSGDAIGS